MTSILTFCTANISASVVIQPLKAKRQNTDVRSCASFALLISKTWTNGTEGRIEDFETGFLGQTVDELGDYYRRFLVERGPMGTMSENWMAVLDENSAAQSAVVMHYGMRESDWDELNEARPDEPIPGTGRVCDDGYIWWKWRIPLRNAYSAFTGLDSTGEKTLGLCCHPEFISPEGVLDVETAVMDRELPDTYGILKGNAEESEDEDGS